MNYDRIAYVLDLVADSFLLHSEPTDVPCADREPYICQALLGAHEAGVVPWAWVLDAMKFLGDLGMVGRIPFRDVLGLAGFYPGHSVFKSPGGDQRQAVRWTWLKFAARLAREEAAAQRKTQRQLKQQLDNLTEKTA